MPTSGPVAIKYVTEGAQRRLDHDIAELATRQHGVVALWQLVPLGLSAAAVRARVRRGRLHPIYRGVYAVGHRRLTAHGRWMAAVLACGPGAALSHRSAAALRGVRRSSQTRVDVISPTRAGRKRKGVNVHRATNLRPQDVEPVDGIPATTLARTFLDLAEVISERALQKALEQADRLDLLDARSLQEQAARNPARHGARRLTRALDLYDPRLTRTRNDLERDFVTACRGAVLPEPEINAALELAPGEWIQPDFLWREQRIIVETDGWDTHGTRAAFERDRRRDQRTLVLGYRTIRSTWRQLAHAPHEVIQTVRALT